MNTESWKSGSGSTTQPHSNMSYSPWPITEVSWSSDMIETTAVTPTSLNQSRMYSTLRLENSDSSRPKRRNSSLRPSGPTRTPSEPFG